MKSVMFTLLCMALRLPDTFRGVSRAVEMAKHGHTFSALTPERLEQIKLVKNKSL